MPSQVDRAGLASWLTSPIVSDNFLASRQLMPRREGSTTMTRKLLTTSLDRRTLIKTGATLGAATVFSSAILTYAQGETPVKIGMHDPFTGTYAAEGESEKRGAMMALEEVNSKGGILGRQVQLILEDDSANAGLAAQKAHKLI